VVFVTGSTLNSTLILMNSTSACHPNGLGNNSGELGHNLMDHNYNASVEGEYEGFQDKYYEGKRPTSTYMPRFRNFGNDTQERFKRGYAYSCSGHRPPMSQLHKTVLGKALKEDLTSLGPWKFSMRGMGECLPYHENKIALSTDKVDQWGIPLLKIDAEYKDNENEMQKDMITTAMEMLEAANFKNITDLKDVRNFGLNIHEMGTARMGRDPRTSVL